MSLFSAVAPILFSIYMISGYVASSNTILPTVSNSTGDYYVSSVSSFQQSTITCELNCHILCNTYHGCFEVSIVTTHTATVSIECTAVWSCGLIKLYGDPSPTSSLSILCTERNACWNSDFLTDASRTPNVSLSCLHEDACSVINIDAKYATKINLTCKGFRACSHLGLNTRNAQFVSITAKGPSAFANASVDATSAKYMAITCASNPENYSACFGGSYLVPQYGTNVVFMCYGSGCYELDSIKAYRDFSKMQININGCGYCDSASECISSAKLGCSDSYGEYSYTTFYGSSCSVNQCACDNLATSTKNRFITDPLDPMCRVN